MIDHQFQPVCDARDDTGRRCQCPHHSLVSGVEGTDCPRLVGDIGRPARSARGHAEPYGIDYRTTDFSMAPGESGGQVVTVGEREVGRMP